MGFKTFIQKAKKAISKVNNEGRRVTPLCDLGDVPLYNMEEEIVDIKKDGSRPASRMRPYDGQPWTDSGERGATLVEGITHRDICDCVALALLTVGGSSDMYAKIRKFEEDVSGEANWSYNDLYSGELDYNKMDPVALLQSVLCFVERYEGIFPNIPKSTYGIIDDSKEEITVAKVNKDVPEIFNIRITSGEYVYDAKTTDEKLADKIFNKTTMLAQCISEDSLGEFSDGYHSFNELYEYRMIYNALLFNTWSKQGSYDVHKSKKHDDGELCFGGGWFIVKAETPCGQISNHYELKDWDLFQCEEREVCSKYDGHSPKDAMDRMKKMLSDSK